MSRGKRQRDPMKPYYRRNAMASLAFSTSGHDKAEIEGTGGGYAAVRVPLGRGYNLHVAQEDPMEDRRMPWAAGLTHGQHREGLSDPHNGPDYSVDLGHAHPRDLPGLVAKHLEPGGELHKQMQEHTQARRNLSRQQFKLN